MITIGLSPQPTVVVGMLAIGFVLLPLLGLPKHGEVQRGSRPVGDAIFHLGLAILSIGLLGLSLGARAKLPLLEPFKSSRVLLELTCAAASVMAVSPLLAILGTGSRGGAPDPRAPDSLFLTIRSAVLRYALAFAPLLLLEWSVLTFLQGIHLPAPPQESLLHYYEAPWGVRLAMIVSIAVAAPIAEETVFRGTLQPALARFVGADTARLAVAVFFGSLHGEVACVPIGVFGYFLGRVRDASGRIVPCVVIHAINNITALLLYAHLPYVRSLYQSF